MKKRPSFYSLYKDPTIKGDQISDPVGNILLYHGLKKNIKMRFPQRSSHYHSIKSKSFFLIFNHLSIAWSRERVVYIWCNGFLRNIHLSFCNDFKYYSCYGSCGIESILLEDKTIYQDKILSPNSASNIKRI